MAASYPQFVLLGDSLFEHAIPITQGFSLQAKLGGLCARRIDVINRGFSGWSSRHLVQHLDQIFPAPVTGSPKIKYLAILIGANDAVLPWSPTKQHVPLEEYKENLGKVISHPSIKAHQPKIFLITPPPIDQIKHHRLDTEAGLKSALRESAISASYSEKAREVARENPNVELVDLWQAIMDRAISQAPNDYLPGGPLLGTLENGKPGGLDTLLPDGLHLGGEAYEILFDLLRPHIEADLEEKPVLPLWRELTGSEV